MLFAVGYQKIQFYLGPLYVVKFVILSSTFFWLHFNHISCIWNNIAFIVW